MAGGPYAQVIGLGTLASDAGYAFAFTAPGAVTVTPKQLTASILADGKTYDGTTAATGTVTLDGVLAGDAVTLTGGIAGDNVGVTTLTGGGNYAITLVPGTFTISVNPATAQQHPLRSVTLPASIQAPSATDQTIGVDVSAVCADDATCTAN